MGLRFRLGEGLLGGSWAVISPVVWVITVGTLLVTPVITTTYEPPSMVQG